MPDISQEELDRLKAQDESAKKLAAKNQELLDEKKKEKDRADALAADKATLEAQKLKDSGDFKTLVEKMEADNKKLKDDNDAKEKQRLNELKKGAFSLELDKLGIKPERKPFILGSVDVSTLQYVEAGNVVLGAEAKAKEILTQMPEIFGSGNNNLPGQGGGSGGGNGGGGAPAHMTDAWFMSLSVADQDKHRAEYFKSKGIDYRPR